MPNIHAKFGGDLCLDWGGGLAYLAANDVLSKAEAQVAIGLYRLVSDEGSTRSSPNESMFVSHETWSSNTRFST